AITGGGSTLNVIDASEFTDPASYSPDFVDYGGAPRPRMCIEVGYDSAKDLSGVGVFTNGSTQVTGIGTLFQSELQQGDFIWSQQDDEVYAEQVSSVPSNVGLNLYRPYGGATATWRARAKVSEFMNVLSLSVSGKTITVLRGTYSSILGRSFPIGTKIREVFWLANNDIN